MPDTNLTQDRLKELLEYNPETGTFTWKVKRKGVNAGDIAGCVRKCRENPYWLIQIDGIQHRAHRLAWLYMTGNWPTDQIDHINQNKSDNRFCNLREVDTVENARNRKTPVHNTSGHIGVYRRGRKWEAAIVIHGTNIHLGNFDSINDAIAARVDAQSRYGFHDNHGS